MTNLNVSLEKILLRQSQFNYASTDLNTPRNLIEKMLDQLPNEIWSDQTKTFCDLSCGTGTFLLCIFMRCFHGLSDIIPDEHNRIKNILIRIHGYDIDFIKCELTKTFFCKLLKQFQISKEDIQVFKQNSLEYNFDMKFDVMCGNPPFQPHIENNGKSSGTKNKIWHKFIEKAFDLVKNDGYMLYVTPNNWKNGSQHLQCTKLMWAKGIQWFLHARQPNDYFQNIVGHSIDIGAWVISMSKVNTTNIFSQLCLLPNSTDEYTMNICEKFFNVCDKHDSIVFNGFEGQRNYNGILYKSLHGDDQHPYKCAGTSSQIKKGYYNWFSYKPPNFDKQKVIVSRSGALNPTYDNGTCGTGDNTAMFEVSSYEEGLTLINFLNSKLIQFITQQFMIQNQFGFPVMLIKKLPKEILKFNWDELHWQESCKQLFGIEL